MRAVAMGSGIRHSGSADISRHSGSADISRHSGSTQSHPESSRPRTAFATPMRIALALPLLAFTLAVMAWATLRTDAAWQFFAAEAITQNMSSARAFTPDGLNQATERLDRALARFPRNPDFLDLAGQLKELRANQPGVVGREQRALLAAAAQDYRRSLAGRPLWPYGWANLLAAKDKLGEVDEEFSRALVRAAETGPWEPRVQLQLIRSGVRHWEQLSNAERERVRETMNKALRVQPREAFEIAQFYARPDLVCGKEHSQPQIVSWCQSVSSLPPVLIDNFPVSGENGLSLNHGTGAMHGSAALGEVPWTLLRTPKDTGGRHSVNGALAGFAMHLTQNIQQVSARATGCQPLLLRGSSYA